MAVAAFAALGRLYSPKRKSDPAASPLGASAAADDTNVGDGRRVISSVAASSTTLEYQFAGKSVINYSYTDFPWKLLVQDVYQFFRLAWALPYIVWPTSPTDSGSLDELAPTAANAVCVAVHVVLCLMQLLFLLSVPLMALFPIWTVTLAVLGFFGVNHAICRLLLNGNDIQYTSDAQYAAALPEHAHEQWIFLNGVAVGEHWLKNNLNRLALTFKRPILGIHNRTRVSGIIFDVIECLIQRNFCYATTDIRLCYSIVKETLYNPKYTKVVFILHSQGGIEGGMVLDWLLQELPHDLLAKLEVYTFGNAANHFNNPHRYLVSQNRALQNGEPGGTNGQVRDSTETGQPAAAAAAAAAAPDRRAAAASPPSLLSETSSTHPSDVSGLAIGHIEHYAHTTDFVALWGVLHFASAVPQHRSMPRFLGRVFARKSPRGGHQLCQHYLDGLFPLARDPATGRLVGCLETGNDFMESAVLAGRDGDEAAQVRQAFRASWLGLALNGRAAQAADDADDADAANVMIHGGSPVVSRAGTFSAIKVKDLSRLWLYRNGKSPGDETL